MAGHAGLHQRGLAGRVELVPFVTDRLFDADEGLVDQLFQIRRQPVVAALIHADAETCDIGVHLGGVFCHRADLESLRPAVIDPGAVDGALLHALDDLRRRQSDRRSAERRHEILDRCRGEAQPHTLHVIDGADRLARGVDVAGLVRHQKQRLQPVVLVVEILAQRRLVEHFGADLRAADQYGRLDTSVSGNRPGVKPCTNQVMSAWPVRAMS